MWMISIRKRSLLLALAGMFLIVAVAFMYLKENINCVEVNSSFLEYRIVVDAGHGKPDGGAVSKEGVEEEKLNLAIAKKLKKHLEECGYEVIMTRETNQNIAEEGKKTLKEIKQSDLENRVKIANQSYADFMISIHMNEYSQDKLWGWQTFYSKNSEKGKRLANLVQEGISHQIDKPNKRTSLPIENIKIIDKTVIPTIIVECGFLSNVEEAKLLQTEEYQEKLVKGMVEGINQYYDKETVPFSQVSLSE